MKWNKFPETVPPISKKKKEYPTDIDYSDKVLVWLPGLDGGQMRTAFFRYGLCPTWQVDGCSGYDVTHWAKITPPKN